MGNLRRLLTFIALAAVGWVITYPNYSEIRSPFTGIFKILIILPHMSYPIFALMLIVLGITIGLIGRCWRKGYPEVDAVVFLLSTLPIFGIMFGLAKENDFPGITVYLFLYLGYFLGKMVVKDVFIRYLNRLIVLSAVLIFFFTLLDMLFFALYKSRFGTRSLAFSPIWIVYSAYMVIYHREDGFFLRMLFVLGGFASLIALFISGFRTAQFSTLFLFLVLFALLMAEDAAKALKITLSFLSVVGGGIILALATTTLVVGPVLVEYFKSRLTSIVQTLMSGGKDLALQIREMDIAQALAHWAEDPLFGASPSDWITRVFFDWSRWKFIDNTYVMFIWKYGIIGVVSLALFLLLVAFYTLRSVVKDRTPFNVLILLSLLNFIILGATTSILFSYTHIAYLSVLLGVFFIPPEENTQVQNPSQPNSFLSKTTSPNRTRS